MKNSAPFLKFALSFVFCLQLIAAQANFFVQANYELAKTQAQKENKLLMLKFGASWCLPCKFMDKNVFGDEKLIEFLKSRVVGLSIDIEQPEGTTLKTKYHVKSVPTIIFITPDGKEISRKENSMGISDFQQWVEVLVREHHISESSKPNLVVSYSSQSRSNNLTGSNLQTQSTNKPANTQTSKIEKNSVEIVNSKVPDYQDKNITLFGQFYVQLGAFTILDNAISKAQELDEQFSQNANILEIEDLKGQTVYKLNLGPFDSEEEAELFVEVLKDRKLEALVKKAEF